MAVTCCLQAKQAALMAKILARKQQQPLSGSTISDSCGNSTVASAVTTTVPVTQTEVVNASKGNLMIIPSLRALSTAGSTSERAPRKRDKSASQAKHASASGTTSTDSGAPVKHQAVSKSTKSEFLKALVAMRKDKGTLALRNIYGMMIHSVHSDQRLHQVTAYS
jgi:hypothetical protein